jgi:hypothetical protein
MRIPRTRNSTPRVWHTTRIKRLFSVIVEVGKNDLGVTKYVLIAGLIVVAAIAVAIFLFAQTALISLSARSRLLA